MIHGLSIWYVPFPILGKKLEHTKSQIFLSKKLSECILETSCNITTDNWFTSIPYAYIMVNQFNLTIVGTLRKTKIEVPPSNKEVVSSHLLSTKISLIYSKKYHNVCYCFLLCIMQNKEMQIINRK